MKLLLLSGGNHPYEKSTPVLSTFLRESGHDVIVSEDAETLIDGTLKDQDALVFNTLRMGELSLSSDQRIGMQNFISSGKGFVCIHISGCVPEEWHDYGEITGGGWVMDKSFHPPYSNFRVDISNCSHPCAMGLSGFDTNDELYMNIDYREGNNVFLEADFVGGAFAKNREGAEKMEMVGGTFPLAWTRSYGSGKVFVTLLGHDGESQANKGFQEVVLNGVNWVTG